MKESWSNFKLHNESKNAFYKFMETAKSHQSDLFCNKHQHEILKNYMKIDDSEIFTEIEVIDLSEIEESGQVENTPKYLTPLTNVKLQTVEDITSSIKEQLESFNQIPSEILKNLEKFSIESIKQIFDCLLEELNNNNVLSIGESLECSITNDLIRMGFCNKLLTKKMLKVYNEEIKELFFKYCANYPNLVIPQVVTVMNDFEEIDTLFSYLNSAKIEIKDEILRELVKTSRYFPKKYILIIDCLIHEKVEFDLLKKLILILATNADEYAKDKEFAKLLIKIINCLGKNLYKLETELKIILGSHKSIWKNKLEKIMNNYFNKSISSMEY